MKKLLALLLALSFPFSALADCVSMNARWTLSPEGVSELIRVFSGGQRYPRVEEWLEELASFVSGFEIVSAVDEEAGYGRAALRYREEELLAYEVAATDAGTAMRYSWLPDTPLLLSPDNLYAQSAGALPKAWRAVDWEATLHAFRAIFFRWADAMDDVDEAGHFAGDAYEGGSYRTAVRFDDRDLALLMDMLLDGPWPERFKALVSQPFLAARTTPDQALTFLRGEIRKAALDNRYRYVLYLDSDERDKPIGLSLIAFEGAAQIATLSVGHSADEPGFTAVLSYGLRGENYHWVIQSPAAEEGSFFSVKLARNLNGGFADAVSNPSDVLWQAALYDRSGGDVSAVEIIMDDPTLHPIGISALLSHAADENGSASSVRVMVNGQRLFEMDLDYDFTQTLSVPDLTGWEQPVDVQSLSSDELIALFKAISSSLDEFGVQLFKLIPPRLITLPMNNRFLSPE